jgi:hypothetical protein
MHEKHFPKKQNLPISPQLQVDDGFGLHLHLQPPFGPCKGKSNVPYNKIFVKQKRLNRNVFFSFDLFDFLTNVQLLISITF